MRKNLQYLFGVLFLIFGLIITLQIKSVQKENNLNDREKDVLRLKQSLEAEKIRSQALEIQLNADEKRVAQYESKPVGKELEGLKAEIDYAKFYAGMTDVSGPGVIITLKDSQQELMAGEKPASALIHDSDILLLINYLKMSGSEAISVNGERIVAVSETQCAGPTISVNGDRHPAPFEIKAIGNADYLVAKLNGNDMDNVLGFLKLRGIQVNVEKSDKIDIPKYRNIFSDNNVEN